MSEMDVSSQMKPRVAVIVFVRSSKHPNCVLVGKRKNAFGEGTYALPGGLLEPGEEIEVCGHRELLEETGLRMENEALGGVVNVVWTAEQKHFVLMMMNGDVEDGMEPVTKEPHKCQGWEWHDWDNLPDNVFPPLKTIKDSGYNPFSLQERSQFRCIEFRR